MRGAGLVGCQNSELYMLLDAERDIARHSGVLPNGPTSPGEDPAAYISYLNTIILQTSILLRYDQAEFTKRFSDPKVASSLGLLIRTFIVKSHDNSFDDGLEKWIRDYIKEQCKEISQKLVLFLARVIDEAECKSFFTSNHLFRFESVFMMFLALSREGPAATRVIKFFREYSHFEKTERYLLEALKEKRTDAVELLLFISQGDLSLNAYMVLLRFADSTANQTLAQKAIHFARRALPETDLDTMHTFISTTKNISSITMARRAKAQQADEFKELLDDKQYVETIKQSVLDMAYDLEFDDEATDLYEADKKMDPFEEELIKAYIKNADLFERTARNSPSRKALCDRLKMSHEQLEGWAVMLNRNPRKERILSDYSLLNYKKL